MKWTFHVKKGTSLQIQRNALLGFCAVLMGIALLQGMFLFVHHERVILLPPEVKQSFWVEGNRFSPIYLEEQGLYFAHLLLDVSEANILTQGEILLRYVDPQAYGAFKKRLFEDAQRLKKDNLSLVLTPVTCEVNPTALQVDITGDLNGYVGMKKVTTHRETYRLGFTSRKGRLFLSAFSVLTTDQPEERHAVSS